MLLALKAEYKKLTGKELPIESSVGSWQPHFMCVSVSVVTLGNTLGRGGEEEERVKGK